MLRQNTNTSLMQAETGRYNEWPLDISMRIYTCIEVYAGHSIVHISEALQKHLIMADGGNWEGGGFCRCARRN